MPRKNFPLPATLRLDYQPLFGKMSPQSSPRRSGWTRAISFVGFSQSCYRLQIFVLQGLSHKLSDQNKVVKMADDVHKTNLAFERVLQYFKLQNLKDSKREAGPGRRRKSSLPNTFLMVRFKCCFSMNIISVIQFVLKFSLAFLYLP